MRLLVIEPGLKLWGSERAFLSSLPELINSYEKLVIMTPPESELVEELPLADLIFEPGDIGGLHRRGYFSRIKVMLHIVRICREYRIDKIYLNQAGLCRIVYQVAKFLNLACVFHVRLVEDIPRCAALVAAANAPIDLIFVSHDMRKRYPEGLGNEQYKRFFVAYDPYELDEKADDCLSRRPNDLACIGRIEAGKGQIELVEALAQHNLEHSNLNLSLYGNGNANDSYEEKLKSLVQSLELHQSVHFHGFVADVENQLKSFKYLISSSHYESLGRTIIEAWNAGVLPICSEEAGGSAEIILASGGGVLYKNNAPSAIASILCEIEGLTELERCFYVGNGREWVRKNLSLEAYRMALTGALFHVSE